MMIMMTVLGGLFMICVTIFEKILELTFEPKNYILTNSFFISHNFQINP